MVLSEVRAEFALFAGLSGEAAEKWEFLCAGAIDKLRASLADGADENNPQLTHAAAGEAYYRYALCQGADAQSVRVGEISVTESSSGGGCENAARLRDELLAGAAGLLNGAGAGIWQVG